MAPQNCCCLSSGNPWQVTKQDIFHSLINYLEENWKTASFWKDQGLRTVWDTKLILPPNIAKSSPPPLLSSVSWSILPTESGFWNAYLLWYHFLYLLYGSMRKFCSVKVASLWNMPAKWKCAESKTPLCLCLSIERLEVKNAHWPGYIFPFSTIPRLNCYAWILSYKKAGPRCLRT